MDHNLSMVKIEYNTFFRNFIQMIHKIQHTKIQHVFKIVIEIELKSLCWNLLKSKFSPTKKIVWNFFKRTINFSEAIDDTFNIIINSIRTLGLDIFC